MHCSKFKLDIMSLDIKSNIMSALGSHAIFDCNRKFSFITEEPLLPGRMFSSLETYLQTPFESQVLAGFTSVPPQA